MVASDDSFLYRYNRRLVYTAVLYQVQSVCLFLAIIITASYPFIHDQCYSVRYWFLVAADVGG
jgi:hypothetical protein